MRSGSLTSARGGRAVMDRSARPSGTHPPIAVLAALRRVRHTPMWAERRAGRGPSALEASAAAHAGVSEPRRSTFDDVVRLLRRLELAADGRDDGPLLGRHRDTDRLRGASLDGPRGGDQTMDMLRRRL